VEHTKSTRIALSFFALIFGWMAGYGSFCIWQLSSDFRRITDFEAMMFYSLFFIGLGWVFVVLPLVSYLPSQSPLYSMRFAPLVGLIGTHVVFFLLLGWWTPFQRSLPYLVYLSVMGIVGGVIFSLGLRQPFLNSLKGRSFLWISPFILATVFGYAAWLGSLMR